MAIKIKGKKVPYQIGGNSSKKPWKGYARGGTVDENDIFDPSEGGQIPRRLQHAVRNPPKTWTPPAQIRPQRYAEGGEVEWQDMGLANPSFNERWLDRAAGAYARRAPSSTEIKALFRAGNESPNRPPDRDFSGYNLFGELKGTAPEDTPVAIKTKNPYIQITEGDLDRGMDVGMGAGPGVMVGKYGAHMLRQAARDTGRSPTPHPVYAKEAAASAERLRPEFRDAYKGWQEDARDAAARGTLEMRGAQGAGTFKDRDVWKNSGWSYHEGVPTKEIPDLGIKLVPLYKGSNKFSIEHPAGDFHKIYDMPPVTFDRNIPEGNGYFDLKSNEIVLGGRPTSKNVKKATDVVVHELQHRIQKAEGMARGANDKMAVSHPGITSEFFPHEGRPEQAMETGSRFGRLVAPKFESNKAHVPSWHQDLIKAHGKGDPEDIRRGLSRAIFQHYKSSAGETQARNVQRRRQKGFRYQSHPEDTQDVGAGLQWVDRSQMDSGIKVHDARDLRNIAKSMVKGEQYRTIKMRDKFPFPEERASGGQIDNPPWFVRNEARMPSGMLKSDIPGRTDKIPLKVAGGSYVLPADIPSALGQGNTMAGGTILEKMFTRGPYGMNVMRAKSGTSTKMARMSSLSKLRKSGYAEGGDTGEDDGSDIIAAGGEFILDPHQVMKVGGGDLDLGHKILDEFVKIVRLDHIKTLKSLPGPKKD